MLGTLVGSSSIKSILGGIAIRESYQSTSSTYKGTSLNKYNASKKRWEQYWVDNSGTTLHILGGIVDGKMILQNEEEGANGKIYNRLAWQKLDDDSVRQTWEQSYDEGESWVIVFDGHYRGKKSE